ncbi:Membrane-associating domain-containing protein [Pleurostoma richardsiae]|uniref:Membrane-associating domain-containing protein n=1 Tax=Pleurostoma richardsiae TaxID=41990 RepID=A0AA38VJQ0_9PEZI|nr:Membrane-associating domain-containing protein [Pleurostoma richardsiae]
MASAGGFALKLLQWFIRGIQFCCTAIVLAIFSYFLATLANHDLHISTWIRAVEGISGAGVLYTLLGLLLLCCLAGHPVTSFIAIVLDIAFVGGFVYVTWANRHGAGSCSGNVNTVFGTGDADTNVVDNGHGGVTRLPSFRTACKLETACFAVSLVAIFFFIFSALVEVALVRHRRKEHRFGPSPNNNYTSGYGTRRRRGLFGFRRNRGVDTDPNANELPEHPHPEQVRDSYATETTRVGETTQPGVYPKYGETDGGYAPTTNGYGHQTAGVTGQPGYRYGDGVYNA